jgi:predicted nucleotidyltransferase
MINFPDPNLPDPILPDPSLAQAMHALCHEYGAQLHCRLRSGSHAYGLAGPQSDVDERGIYIVPPDRYAGLSAIPNQISDAKGDHVYYSLRRVVELIAESNPTLMEIIFTPPDCILACSSVLQPLFSAKSQLLSQALVRAKLGYAMGQIKKARGQNKWINQPQPEAAPTAQQFCHWLPASIDATDALPGRPKPLALLPVSLEHCHVARVEHAGHWYRLYHIGPEARGVFRGGGMPVCESIAKAIETSSYLGLMMFNEQGFQRAKLDHHNYWRWREERNDARWLAQEHGQLDYDAKNLMHCMRLLFSARNVLEHGAPLVRVAGDIQAELIAIRTGQFSYKALIQRADSLVAECEAAMAASKLPEQVDLNLLNQVFWQVNKNFQMQVNQTN